MSAKKVDLCNSTKLPAQHNAISLSLTLIKGSDNMLCPSTLSKIAGKGHLLFSKTSQSTSLLLLFLSKFIPTSLSQKPCSAVQPMRASLRPQYRFHLTAALSVLCVCVWLLWYVSVLHHGGISTGLSEECVILVLNTHDVRISSYPDSPHGRHDLHPTVGPGHVKTPHIL